MRVFHELVFEYYFEAPTGGMSNPFHWAPVMGAVDTLRFSVVADHVAGTSPGLTVLLQETPDLTTIQNTAKTLIDKELTPGETNLLSASIAPSEALPGSYAYSLSVAFNGTGSPKAHVRIWVTGRGRA